MALPPFSSTTPNATPTLPGKVQLIGDLGGTAIAPTTPTALHLAGSPETITVAKTWNAGTFLDGGTRVYDARIAGVVADCQQILDGAITSGTAILTSTTGLFVSGNVGKSITINGAGAAGVSLRTTVLSYQSATQITLSVNASSTVTGATVTWGTDSKTFIQNALNAANGIVPVYLPKGNYYSSGRITPPINSMIFGAGKGITTIYGGSASDYLFYSVANPTSNIFIQDMTLDNINLTNGSLVQLYYATNCILNRVEFKNGASGGWLLKLGVTDGVNDGIACLDNKIIDCDFDTHAGTLEMLLIYNAKNTQIIRPKFRNKTTTGPAFGLWQKCYDTKIIQPDFKNLQGSCIYYSVTVEDTYIEAPYCENTGNGIVGANTSDNGNFGLNQAQDLKIVNPIIIGGSNSTSGVGIQLGSVNNATIINPHIEKMQIGIKLNTGNNANTFAATNFSIIGGEVRNNNASANVHLLHPGIFLAGIGGSLYGTIRNVKLYDDQGTITQRYPIVFDGAFTWDNIQIVGNRLNADIASSATSVALGDGASLGSNILIRNNQDYSGNSPAQTVTTISEGGTGSTTQNFVDLTTGQTVAGSKNLTSILNLNTPTFTGAQLNINSSAVPISFTDSGGSVTTGGLWRQPITANVLRWDTNTAVAGDFSTFITPMTIKYTGQVAIGQAIGALNFLDVAGTINNAGGITFGQLSAPAAPTVTNQGSAGSTNYTYAITARTAVGETLISSTTQTTTGNATLNGTNFNRITWSRVAGAKDYRVWRTASAGSPSSTGTIGTVTLTATLQFDDTGISASGNTPTNNTTNLSGVGTASPTAYWDIAIGNSSAASLRIRSSTSPTSPNDGDIWYDGTHLQARLGSTTYQLDQQSTAPATLVSKIANYTLTASDDIVLGDTTGGGFTLTLPTAVSIQGREYTIKKIVAANTLTLATTSSQTIDGSTTIAITNQYESLTVVSDNTNWQVI